jgi:hypothetical protein
MHKNAKLQKPDDNLAPEGAGYTRILVCFLALVECNSINIITLNCKPVNDLEVDKMEEKC